MKLCDLTDKLKNILSALRNVPVVGEVYDQQHSDVQLAADVELCEIIEQFENGECLE